MTDVRQGRKGTVSPELIQNLVIIDDQQHQAHILQWNKLFLPGNIIMPITRAIASGNSQAVLIPDEIAFADINLDLTITRLGETVTIFPSRQTLKTAVARLRALPMPPEAELRDPITVPMRERD